jgi:hypothetical protein
VDGVFYTLRIKEGQSQPFCLKWMDFCINRTCLSYIDTLLWWHFWSSHVQWHFQFMHSPNSVQDTQSCRPDLLKKAVALV